LEVYQQSDDLARERAEKMAVEEIKGYLRYRYNVDEIFSESGNNRNDYIIMIVIDITLYHLSSWLPKRMGNETRKERYEAAVKWLDKVQSGKIMPALPTVDTDTEIDSKNPIQWGSMPKSTYDY
jgi:phage gp36-like protein